MIRNKTIPELKELAISFIEDGAFNSALDCIENILRIRAKRDEPQ